MLSNKFLATGDSLLLVVASASAQTPAGVITGRIADATGLPLPGVDVTLQGIDINRTFTTGIDGRYRFLDLAPGDYKVTSALTGFATSVRDRVVVDLGQTVDLTITLPSARERNRHGHGTVADGRRPQDRQRRPTSR